MITKLTQELLSKNPNDEKMTNIRKIKKEEFEKLKTLFPDNDEMWIKYKKMRIEQFEKEEIDVFVIEDNGNFIGEITVNYVSHELETETIPNQRVYLEAFRVDKKYQGQGLGQKLINYCIEYLIKKGYTQFIIGVEDNNEIAKHIYFKLGFNEEIDKGQGDEFDPSEYTLYLKDINKTKLQKDIEILIKKENLGILVKSTTKVTGGLSHRMYKVVTDKEIYAIKELNTGVMKRQEAYSNFAFSEKVSDIAKENGITAIRAIKLKNNDIIRKINSRYFMAFIWIEGKTLKAKEITERHCEIIGEILAKIHNIDFSKIEDNERKKINIKKFEWNKYLKLLKSKNKDYFNILEQNVEILYELNKKANEAIKCANKNLIISHADLDRKNVIWQDYKPFIIDWEASGYINPTIELIQVAWYWSGGDIENLDYNKFKIVINSYKRYSKRKIDTNIEKIIYADIYGGLEWLDYNFKRALCIENDYKKDEIELAESEIIQSIGEIKYNVSQMNKMIEILNK